MKIKTLSEWIDWSEEPSRTGNDFSKKLIDVDDLLNWISYVSEKATREGEKTDTSVECSIIYGEFDKIEELLRRREANE